MVFEALSSADDGPRHCDEAHHSIGLLPATNHLPTGLIVQIFSSLSSV